MTDQDLCNPSAATTADLRRFGVLFATVFLAIGFWPTIFRSESPTIWITAVGLAFAFLSAIGPGHLQQPYRAWMWLAGWLAWINTRVILGLVFFLMVTPIGFLARSLGHDPLRLRQDATTHSQKIPLQCRDSKHIERPF